jgi:hypothetical protein
MRTLITLSIITALLLWYALQGRDWLKSKPWAWTQRFFAWVEPAEIFLFKKSRMILLARLLKWFGVILTTLQQFDGVDLTPILLFVPENYRWFLNAAVGSLPLLITIIGWMVEKLRNETNDSVETAALPDKVKELPEVAQVLAKADEAKEELKVVAAVAVAEAKAA